MALELFERPLSPYSRKVKIALYEKGTAFSCLSMSCDDTRGDAA